MLSAVRRWLPLLGAIALLALLYHGLAPATVNGDGLGYLKSSPTGIVVPGHLGYLPLMRGAGRLFGASSPFALLGPARLISLLSGLLATLALFAAARLRMSQPAALVAALGLGVSFGVVQAASDVETYAPALAALCLATWCGLARTEGGGAVWLGGAILSTAVAALLHVENVLFVPAIALLCRNGRRRHDLWIAPLGTGLLVGSAYATAWSTRGDTFASGWHWLTRASHGFSYPLGTRTPIAALYGIAKTLVYSPYPHEASWWRVAVQTLLGLVTMSLAAWLVLQAQPPFSKWVLSAWIVPYSVVGITFYASDNERWLFLLPPLWLTVGQAAEGARPRRVAVGLLVLLTVFDLGLGLPVARDATVRDRATALSGHLRRGDLVISPGHGWDEYLGFFQEIPIEPFPLVYFCGHLGSAEAMRRDLAHRAIAARARRARIFLARLDSVDGPDGWKELRAFGVTPENVSTYLPVGRRVPIAPQLQLLEPAADQIE